MRTGAMILTGGASRRMRPFLQPGARVRDWQVKRSMASGGFGAVYEVEHVVLGRRAALKVLHPVLCRSGAVMVGAFHPELSGDGRLHELFLDSVA